MSTESTQSATNSLPTGLVIKQDLCELLSESESESDSNDERKSTLQLESEPPARVPTIITPNPGVFTGS
jgi:hypothetical protein